MPAKSPKKPIPKKLIPSRKSPNAVRKRLTDVCKLNAWFKHYTNEACSTTFLNKVESARRAGYKCKSEESLRKLGCKNFTKVADKLEKWFDEVGLSENALRKKLLSLIGAKETKFFSTPQKDADGKTVDIMIVEREVEAIETQRRTLDMAIKVRGMYAAERHEHAGPGGGPIEIRPMALGGLHAAIESRRKTD